MRFSRAAAAAVLLVCGAANADEQTFRQDSSAAHQPTLGVGMICNTADQAEHFLKLRAGGTDPSQAMDAVNKEAENPRACGIAAVAFFTDQTMGTQTVENRLLQVVRINVVAGYNRTGWHHVTNMVQYAVIEQKGYGI